MNLIRILFAFTAVASSLVSATYLPYSIANEVSIPSILSQLEVFGEATNARILANLLHACEASRDALSIDLTPMTSDACIEAIRQTPRRFHKYVGQLVIDASADLNSFRFSGISLSKVHVVMYSVTDLVGVSYLSHNILNEGNVIKDLRISGVREFKNYMAILSNAAYALNRLKLEITEQADMEDMNMLLELAHAFQAKTFICHFYYPLALTEDIVQALGSLHAISHLVDLEVVKFSNASIAQQYFESFKRGIESSNAPLEKRFISFDKTFPGNSYGLVFPMFMMPNINWSFIALRSVRFPSHEAMQGFFSRVMTPQLSWIECSNCSLNANAMHFVLLKCLDVVKSATPGSYFHYTFTSNAVEKESIPVILEIASTALRRGLKLHLAIYGSMNKTTIENDVKPVLKNGFQGASNDVSIEYL